jgi:hypothetical protein
MDGLMKLAIGKKGLLFVGSLLIALVMVEGILRLVGYDVNAHPFWTYHPGLGWVIDENGPFDRIDATGFRHNPVSLVKPPGTRRVLILGDSFSLGSGFEFSKTFPGILERWLADTGAWEVVALAVDDWGWSQQLIALESYGLDYSPDVVVSQMFPLNDFCNNCLVTANTCSMQDSHRPYFVLKDDRLELTSLYPWRKKFRDRLRVVGLLENLLDDPWAKARRLAEDESVHPDLSAFFEHNACGNGLHYPDAIQALLPPEHQQEEIEECWQVSEKILSRMASIVRDYRIPLLVSVVPFLYCFPEHWPELDKISTAPVQPFHATSMTERILTKLEVPTISVRSKIEGGMR